MNKIVMEIVNIANLNVNNTYINLNKANNDAFVCNNIKEVGLNNPISLLFITSLNNLSEESIREFGVGTNLSYFKAISSNDNISNLIDKATISQ